MDYEVTREYTETVRKLEETDPSHADLFNQIYQALFNNDAFMKMTADSLAEKMLEKGMIVDNFTSERSDLPGSAGNDKRLYDMLTEQNKNINGTFYPTGDLLEWANSNKKTISASFSNACTNLPASGDFTVFRVENGGFLATMFAVRVQDRKMFVSYFNTGAWSDWAEYVINNDLNNKLSIDRIIANCEEVQIDTDGWGHINFARELGNDWYIILFAYPPGWNFLTRNASKNGFDVQVLINETPVKEQKLWITWLAITP